MRGNLDDRRILNNRRCGTPCAWAGGMLFLLTCLFASPSPGQTRPESAVSPAAPGRESPVAQAPGAKEKGPPPGSQKPSPQAPGAPPQGATRTLKLSLKDRVRIGLARNCDIRIEQLNPRIRTQDTQREEAAFDVVGLAGVDTGETFLPSNSALSRIERRETSTQTFNAGIRQRLQTGTSYEVSTSLRRNRDNAGFVRFDPALEPALSLSLTQNLLKNLGIKTNTTAIRVARNNERISASEFRNRVINVVSDIENLYWELIFSIQDLEVKKQSLSLARDLLRRNKIQVEVGTMAPIEIFQAEASVASREADLITSEQLVRDNEDRLKRALNLPKDITSWDVRIDPTDTPTVIRRVANVRDSFRKAVENRPDYAQAKLDIENKNIQAKFAKNQLFPTLDLTGSFALNGLDEGVREALGDLGSGEFYQWKVGLVFEIPLRNRAAKSALTQRKLEAAQSLLSLKNLEQQIFLEVREAVRGILTTQKRVNARSAARTLAEKQLDAEEKKFTVGLSTSFQVLEFQDDLATAQSNETRAITDEIRALVTYQRVTGQTLSRHQIGLKDFLP